MRAEDVIGWLHSDIEMPTQLDVRLSFGQPPVTLYRSSRFVVDVYYWLDGTTTIHDHAFSGAFQVLCGASVHGKYAFCADDEISSLFHVGQTQLLDMELLSVGQTRRIESGRSFIHSLFHLDRPSVTVVVRTIQELNRMPQFNYLPPSFGIAAGVEDQRTDRRIRGLSVLREIDETGYWTALLDTVAKMDLHATFLLIQDLVPIDDPDKLDAILSAARRAHGEPVDLFYPVLKERLRQRQIFERRRHIRGSEHRFFLALLLNAPEQTQVFDLITSRFGSARPEDTIIRWVRELNELPSPTSLAENAIGIPFDDDSLDVFRHMLAGLSFEQITARLTEERDPESVFSHLSELRDLYQALRSYPLFKALFTVRRG